MSRIVALILTTVCCLSGYANAASAILSYDSRGDNNGILGITGIEQESSWRCRNDPAITCTCPTQIFQGRIAKIDYRSGSALSTGFILETPKGAQYINLSPVGFDDLGTASVSWVPRLIRVGENIMVVAELCGMSGRSVMARDIFSRRMLDEAAAAPQLPAGVKNSRGVAGQIPAATVTIPREQSTYDRLMSEQKQPASKMADEHAAYKSGRMSAYDARRYEQEVLAGKRMLPRGETLLSGATGAEPLRKAVVLPKAVWDAYIGGKMTNEDMVRLEADARAGIVEMPEGVALKNSEKRGFYGARPKP